MHFVTPAGNKIDIASAVEHECVRVHSDGSVERADERAMNVARMLGGLIELLHNRGVLNAEEVEGLVGSHELKRGTP